MLAVSPFDQGYQARVCVRTQADVRSELSSKYQTQKRARDMSSLDEAVRKAASGTLPPLSNRGRKHG